MYLQSWNPLQRSYTGNRLKYITNLIIDLYNLKDIDFMGYTFNKSNASYHHLIIPRRLGGKETIENGAVLNGKTSHPYLHVIEAYDENIFIAITEEILEQKALGRLDEGCLNRIDCLLTVFEKIHKGMYTSKGKPVVRDEYIKGRRR